MTDGGYQSARRKNSTPSAAKPVAKTPARGRILTQHTGLPPRENGAGKGKPAGKTALRKPR